MNETLRVIIEKLAEQTAPSVPTIGLLIFLPLALLIGIAALLVGTTKNLFHSSLCLVASLFGIAALYVTLEAEFIAVSQVLIYIGAISTLITFAIMLTRGMMFGGTSPVNKQMLASIIMAALLFFVLSGVLTHTPWATAEAAAIAAQKAAALAATNAITSTATITGTSAITGTGAVTTSPTVSVTSIATDTQIALSTTTTVSTNSIVTTDTATNTTNVATDGVTSTVALTTMDVATVTNQVTSTEVVATVGDITPTGAVTVTSVVTSTIAVTSTDAVTATSAVTDTGPSIIEQLTKHPLPLLPASNVLIAQLGKLFVTTYLIPFELMALLLLVALAGAILLARDRKQ